MNEKTINVSMELISIAGDAKGKALFAMKKANQGKFLEAKELSKEARAKLNEVHKVHANIIQSEAAGEEFDIKTLFIHAQDHFMGALIILDLVDHIIELYERK